MPKGSHDQHRPRSGKQRALTSTPTLTGSPTSVTPLPNLIRFALRHKETDKTQIHSTHFRRTYGRWFLHCRTMHLTHLTHTISLTTMSLRSQTHRANDWMDVDTEMDVGDTMEARQDRLAAARALVSSDVSTRPMYTRGYCY